MPEALKAFASYLQFKEIFADPLGHLYRAGEFDSGGIKRAVWLRVFDRPQAPATDIISGFERAQKIAAAVQSTNMTTGLDCVVDGGIPAIVSDYIASQPLSLVFDRVAEEQFPIPVDNALLILEKIALALSSTLTVEIDGQRIVHGFLHPGLVFVTNDGEGVVTGFGIGDQLLALVDDASSSDLVHPYLAPEVIVARTPSRYGDVYSLGAILFHLLTGSRLPTEAGDRKQAIDDAEIAHDETPVPDDIRALLQRALAERPEERYSSAADFKKELDRLLYGGAYSPTTFNLALFMDRLFRAEIEAEEELCAAEMAVDVTPYLAPTVEAEPEALIGLDADTDAAPGIGRGSWIGIAGAAAVVVAASTIFMVTRGPQAPPPPPTPTAGEVAAQRQAQERRIRELAEGLVSEMMAEKEDQIRTELLDRQTKIEDLQKRLQASERRANQGKLSGEEQRRREELQRQIAAEEEVQKQREAELEAERQRAAEEALQQAVAQQTATAAAEEEARLAAVVTPTAAPPSPEPIAVSTPEPTAITATATTIEENSFVDPSEVDLLPVVIKENPVEWPREALLSRRQGVVIIQATVDAGGKVVDLKVLRADHEEFGIPQAVMAAARSYRFKPGTKDGVPITTYATVTKAYRFVIR